MDKIKELEELSKPLVEWLLNNFNPMYKIIIESDKVEVVSGEIMTTIKYNGKCEHCKALKMWDDDLQEEIDYFTCEKKNELDSNNYQKEYSSLSNEVLEEDCKYYLCNTCRFKKEIKEQE